MRQKFGDNAHNADEEEREMVRGALNVYEALEDERYAQRMLEMLA
jgi:hypothetical protein